MIESVVDRILYPQDYTKLGLYIESVLYDLGSLPPYKYRPRRPALRRESRFNHTLVI
jgi:hypothetical protein